MEANDSKRCTNSPEAKPIFTAWFAVYLLFLPILLYVLYVGYKQWKTHPSGFSHSDVITFHMVALELCCSVCSCLYYRGYYSGSSVWAEVGGNAVNLSLWAQVQFHCLTCVERYLAVVHPITYLRLKRGGGVTVRNVSVGCVWLFSLGHVVLTNVEPFGFEYKVNSAIVYGAVSLVVTGFCSVSITCVLIRPGPGEGGGDKRSVDQTKRSALETVLTIQGVLLVRFVALLATSVVSFAVVGAGGGAVGGAGGGAVDRCTVIIIGMWFSLPSSLVLPLLFLRRAGKLACFHSRK